MWDFLGSLGNFFDFGSVLSAIGQVLAYVVNLVVTALQWLLSVLEAIGNFFLGIFRAVGRVFKWLYDTVFKGILTKLGNAVIAVHRWLEAHLGPVLKFLTKVRAYFDKIFKLYIRPILNLIDRIRKVLLILRLLHVKWAVALDTKLAQVEGDIARLFLEARGVLNNIIDVVNGLVDPPRLARTIAGTIAGRRAAAVIIRATTGLPAGFFFPSTSPTAPLWERPVTSSRDITDPLRNPPPSVLVGSLLPIPVSDFLGTNPPPPDEDLDDVEPFGYGAEVLEQLLGAEASLDDAPDVSGNLYDALVLNVGVVATVGHGFENLVKALNVDNL